MKLTVQFGDLSQAAYYGKLDEHMANFAKQAEAADPGGTHTLEVPESFYWAKRMQLDENKLIGKATSKFFESIEKLRSTP